MGTTVLIAIKDVYGVQRAYPANDAAKLLAELAGTKTLSDAHLRLIAALGYQIDVEAPKLRSPSPQPAAT